MEATGSKGKIHTDSVLEKKTLSGNGLNTSAEEAAR